MKSNNKNILTQRTKKRIIKLSKQTKHFIEKDTGENMSSKKVKVNMTLRTIKNIKMSTSIEVPYNSDEKKMIEEAKNQVVKSLENSPWQVASLGEVSISKA